MGEKVVRGAQVDRPRPAFGNRSGMTGIRAVNVFASAGRTVRRKTAKAARKAAAPKRSRSPARKTRTKTELRALRLKNLAKARRAKKAKANAAK